MSSEELSQYIYGVIPAKTEGLAGIVAAQTGAGRNGLKTVVFDDLAAVVSPAAPVAIAKMRKDDLARLLVEHQKTIELIMGAAMTVIPFRLGTYAGSSNEITGILARGQRLMRRIFAEVDGQIELDVVASWTDLLSVFKEIGEQPEIKRYKGTLGGNPRRVSADAQMKLGLLVKKALDAGRQELCRVITAELGAIASRRCDHENMDDQMVMNSAFLLDIPRRAQFERRLDELDARFEKKLNFRCVGPLPPYSFFTLEYKQIQWEDVDWARGQLGLGDSASVAEIKKAFQHAAFASHPDHCAGQAAAGSNFLDLDRARRILQEYLAACEQEQPVDRIFFSAESVRKNAILVRERSPK